MNKTSSPRGALWFGVLLVALAPISASAQEPHHHWAYSGADGPKEWGHLDSTYSPCSAGHVQSPIDIKKAKKADLPQLQFNYQRVPLNLIDNGHTVQVNYPAGSTLTVGDKTYTLKQFHFHHPSEEHVRGHEYDMVAHLVHADANGHLAVVAVFLEKGNASNKFIDSVWKNFPSEKEKAVDVPSVNINLNDLLPPNHAYYTFSGSLTTPPCSEGVTWYVLENPVTLSEQQIAVFTKLYPRNARPIQAAYGREVLESK